MDNISDVICCGCGACVNICPKSCIKLEENNEGFYSAVVFDAKCIECGLCRKACTVLNAVKGKLPITAYIAHSINDEIRKYSSSGGIFTHLAERIINDGGVVFGAAFDSEMKLKHYCAKNMVEVMPLRGSKYIQSWAFDAFAQVEKELGNSKKVLFSGTPCQVAALYAYLGNKPDNLFTVDLICHGVASPRLFSDYLSFLSKKYKGKITDYNFRSKEYANSNISYTAKISIQKKNGIKDVFIDGDEDPFSMQFIGNALQNQYCYQCSFTKEARLGDITLGDYWGYEQLYPQLRKVKGVSLVLVSSKKGDDLLKSCPDLFLMETSRSYYLQFNHHLQMPPSKNPIRDKLYFEYQKVGFTYRFYKKYFLPKGFHKYLLKRRIRRFF